VVCQIIKGRLSKKTESVKKKKLKLAWIFIFKRFKVFALLQVLAENAYWFETETILYKKTSAISDRSF